MYTAPQTQFYNNLGQECVQAGCSVSLFLVNNAYVDLPTVGQVVRLTGGEVHKYTYFQVRGLRFESRRRQGFVQQTLFLGILV